MNEETEHGVLWANQFVITDDRRTRFKTTGSEIQEQLKHQVDAFVCAVVASGILARMGRILR